MKNTTTFSRRSFLQASAAGIAGASFLTNISWAAKSNIIACRDVHFKDMGGNNPWQAFKTLGIQGAEVWVNNDRTLPYLSLGEKKYSIKSKDEVKALAKDLDANGVTITAFAMPNQFDSNPEEQLAWVKDTVEAAKLLKVNAIRIDLAPVKIQDKDAFLKFSIDLGKKITAMVKGTPIHFGIENHGHVTNDPNFLTPLFKEVGSDALGLTLDTGNFYWFGHPLEKLYGLFEQFASRVCHTHCKSINYPEDKRNAQREIGWKYGELCCPIDQGNIDFTRVVKILKAANYQGDYCIEDESLERSQQSERAAIVKREIDFLKKLV